MAGDIGVFHKMEVAHAVERAWKESFIIAAQRTNCNGISDPFENLRKEENETKEEPREEW